MLIRAGASNAPMASVLGANVDLLKTLLFLLGAVLAGVAGALAGPILSVQSGMGEPVLILALVVIVVGGIGSVRGTLVAALLIAMIDTLGRAFLPDMLRAVFDASVANAVGPALASMLIYVLMAVVLAFRPQGLVFSARR
jgi:branched-chain amino acid transport system permease protein